MEKKRVHQLIPSNLKLDNRQGIILFGEGGCGKSSTLQHLIVLLCGGGKRIASIQAEFEDVFYDKSHNIYRDAEVIVQYKMNERQSLTIYISTRGDSWPIVEDNYRFFYQCVRSTHKVYTFDGKTFVKLDSKELKTMPAPQFCISPASYMKSGGLQAHHYCLDLTIEDWRLVRWIRKYHCSNPGAPVPDYTMCNKIRMHDEKLEFEIISAMKKMLKENYN